MADDRLRLVAELQNKASAELKKLQRDMGSVKPSAGMAQAKTWFERLSGASETANRSLRPLSSGLNMVGAGGLAAGLSIAGLAKQFIDLAKALPQLKELSRQTGMSATEIERLKAAAGDLNVDPSKMQASLSSFSRMMVDFHKRHGDLYEEMVNHGAAGLAEKIRQEDPAAAYRDVLKWLDAIPAAAQRAGRSAADAVQIQRHWAGEAFGDEDMAQLVSKGMKGFEEAYAQATRDVHEITQEAIAAAEAFDRSIARFERTWKDFETTVGPTVFDNLRHATDDFREVFDEIKGAIGWYQKFKDHPVQAAGQAAAKFIDEQAAHNSSTEDRATRAGGPQEKIIVDVPGIASRVMHYFTDPGPTTSRQSGPPQAPPRPRPLVPVPTALQTPAPKPIALRPPTASAFHPDDDRASRARASDADGLMQQRDLQQGVLQQFGALDKPVVHLVGTLKTAAAEISGDGFRPAAFHPAALGAGLAASDPVGMLAAGVKQGMLEAMRELQGESGDGTAGGVSGAAAGIPNMRYGRSASGSYRGSPGSGAAGGITAVSKDLTPEARALLDTLASGEAPDYNVMNGGGRFSDYSHHPGGRAAGRYQFLPSTWGGIQRQTGISDFSPESQDKGAWYLAQRDYRLRTGRNLQADLATHDPGRIASIGQALHPTWVSLNGGFGSKYDSYLSRQTKTGGGGVSDAAVGRMPGLIHGNLKIGDETYRYGSGGASGSAHVPYGDYPINPDSNEPWGKAHNAMDVNNNGTIWDAALGRMRTGIEMHAASTAEMVTHGCLGFLRDQYPQLKQRVREMIARTGHAYLHINENGASIDSSPIAQAVQLEKEQKAESIRKGRPVAETETAHALLKSVAAPAQPAPEPRVSDADYKAALARLPGFQNRRLSDAEKAQSHADDVLMDRYHTQQREAVKVDVTDSSAANLGAHVGKQLPAWMRPGANGPLETRDMRDPRFAPKPAPLPDIAPEPPPRPRDDRAEDADPSHLHVHLHQDGRVRSVRTDSPKIRLHLDTGRTFTQFA